MLTQLRKHWNDALSSLWFLPSLLIAASVIVALVIGGLDENPALQELMGRFPRVFTAGPEGARLMLSSIASSTLTVTGVAFSVTVVVMTLTSTQFSPRVLHNFMRDKANQLVLGMFLGTFTYSLLVLRTVHSAPEPYVPVLGVTGAIVLAVADMALFIFFINHIAGSIHVTTLIARIGRETVEVARRLFPQEPDDRASEQDATPIAEPPQHGIPVPSPKAGFLQLVNIEKIMEIACHRDLRVHIERNPGDFLLQGQSLARVFAQNQNGDEERALEDVIKSIQEQFAIGENRTLDQDVEFGIAQLEEVAVKALSPGINDPATAVACLGYIGSVLREVAQQRTPSGVRYQGQTIRIVTRPRTFQGMADLAFNQIRRYGSKDVRVLTRILEVVGEISEVAQEASKRDVLLDHAARTAEVAKASVQFAEDRKIVNRSLIEVCERIGRPDCLSSLLLDVEDLHNFVGN